ncbi:hypothetical protein D3C85_1133900 [compost metagenome]
MALQGTNDGITIANPAKGLIVFNTNTNIVQLPYGEGLYLNSGTPASPIWEKLATQKSVYTLNTAIAIVATAPVTVAAGTQNNIDIGLSLTITIPANSSTKIVVDYSVPMGTYPFTDGSNTNVDGYFGIHFLKNGTEEQMGSRKFSVPFAGTNAASKMVNVAGKFIEEVSNATASDITITYTLNGYIEGTGEQTRFNMAAATGDNFNWGKGSMSILTYVKSL